MRTVVPTPGWDVTQITPRCPSMIRCEIDNPKPTPLGLVVKKGVKSWAFTAGHEFLW